MSVQDEIRRVVDQNKVVLFMKGNRMSPQCGFSARAVDILDEYLDDYRTVNVLADPQLRDAIKDFSSWPTIPQLYVDSKFVGGSDIIHEMTRSGELGDVLGTARIELSRPQVTMSKTAEAAFLRFWEAEGDTEEPVVRLTIGSNWEPLLDLDQQRDGDLVMDMGELDLVMTRSTARRAAGVVIDFIDRSGQMGFKVEVPERPPMVGQLSVEELKRWIDENKPHLLVDVRTAEEWATAKIESAVQLGDLEIEALDKDKTLVFMCHHGMRSAQAAQHMLAQGFRDVHNLQGGIDAWSNRIDSDVPRY